MKRIPIPRACEDVVVARDDDLAAVAPMGRRHRPLMPLLEDPRQDGPDVVLPTSDPHVEFVLTEDAATPAFRAATTETMSTYPPAVAYLYELVEMPRRHDERPLYAFWRQASGGPARLSRAERRHLVALFRVLNHEAAQMHALLASAHDDADRVALLESAIAERIDKQSEWPDDYEGEAAQLWSAYESAIGLAYGNLSEQAHPLLESLGELTAHGIMLGQLDVDALSRGRSWDPRMTSEVLLLRRPGNMVPLWPELLSLSVPRLSEVMTENGAPGYQSYAWTTQDWRVVIVEPGGKVDYGDKCGAPSNRTRSGKVRLCLPRSVIQQLLRSKKGEEVLIAQARRKERAAEGERVPWDPMIRQLHRQLEERTVKDDPGA